MSLPGVRVDVQGHPIANQRHYTEDYAQVGVERLWWSFYLVWRPSSQEIPGSFSVQSPPPPNYRLLLAITVIDPSFYWFPQYQTGFQSSALYLWALWNHYFVKMSSSTWCCTVFLFYVFDSQQRPYSEWGNYHDQMVAINWSGISYWKFSVFINNLTAGEHY
jgi:hypothetical protein